MRTITKKINIYTFNEASSELKDKIREYFASDNFLYEFKMQERIETLKKYTEFIGGTLDYSLSCVPDRGEFITVKGFDQKLFLKSLKLKDCALTGVCYDNDLIEFINKVGELNTGLNMYINSIHSEYESMLENDYLNDLCEANGYEFLENGKLNSY